MHEGGLTMAILWIMEWPGISPAQYEQLRGEVGWQGEAADGLKLHVAAFDRNGLIVTEVWESADHVQPFMDERLLPAIEKLGVTTMPKVDLHEVHALFAPDPNV
jgi:hypothetical protein